MALICLKFLVKNKKWYIYHDSRTGGIYAQIVRNGVKIIFNDEIKVFNNFDKLEAYLDKILTQEKPNFIKYVHNRWEEISKDE